MTSSGRRVKRKNLDEFDDSHLRKNRNRKRNGRKASSKKHSSKSRPQRAAARNALHLFSRITGASAEEDINDSDGDSSESGSTLQDSSFGSEESDASLQNEWSESLKGKEISLDHAGGVDHTHSSYHESHSNAVSRKRLILKLPNRDSSKYVSKHDGAGSSSGIPQKVSETNNSLEEEECHVHGIERSNLDLLGECKDASINWGGVRARSTKRLKMGESSSASLFARSGSVLDPHIEAENIATGHSTIVEEHQTKPPSSEIQNEEVSLEEIVYKKGRSFKTKDDDESPCRHPEVCNGTKMPSANGTGDQLKSKENGAPTPTKLRIRTGSRSRDNDNPRKTLLACSAEGPVKYFESCENPDREKNLVLPESDNNDQYGVPESEGFVNGASSGSHLEDLLKVDSHKRMFTAVYRRSRCRSNPEGDSGSLEASTSNVEKRNLDEEIEIPLEGSIRRARSTRLRPAARDLNLSVSNFKFEGARDNSEDASADVAKASPGKGEEDDSCGEWKLLSRNSIRSRSTRTKRSSSYIRDISPPRKLIQTGKSSWLMLSVHEEGSRYIPQLGDDVVYLRQVDAC